MGLQVLYPLVEAGKAEDLKAEYALCIYFQWPPLLLLIRHAGMLTYSNQRRRRPWTQRRPDEHLDKSQDEGILAQGLPPPRPPQRPGYDLWIQRKRGVWQYNCRHHRSCQ